MRDEKSILPISAILHKQYGIDDIALSMPAIVGSEGLETHVPIRLNEDEQSRLKASAESLKKIVAELDI